MKNKQKILMLTLIILLLVLVNACSFSLASDDPCKFCFLDKSDYSKCYCLHNSSDMNETTSTISKPINILE